MTFLLGLTEALFNVLAGTGIALGGLGILILSAVSAARIAGVR